jgi:hypothetical protein
MAITRKPAKPAEAQPVDVDALIRKGGSVAAEAETDTGKAAVVLRIPAEAMARIDQAVQARRVKTPRHTWLLEAVMEKLDREAAE